MRFLAWRRRSVQWCGVYVFALLATGAYLAFEVLDLDASQMRAVPATAAVTAPVPRVDPDPEHRSTSMSGPAGLLFLSETNDRKMALRRAALAAGTATPAARRNPALPRGRVARDTGCISAPTSDPAQIPVKPARVGSPAPLPFPASVGRVSRSLKKIDRPLGPGDRVIYEVGEGPRGPVARRIYCVWRAKELGIAHAAG